MYHYARSCRTNTYVGRRVTDVARWTGWRHEWEAREGRAASVSGPVCVLLFSREISTLIRDFLVEPRSWSCSVCLLSFCPPLRIEVWGELHT